MERVRADGETFRLIFAQHHRFVFRFLYAMVGEHDLAEDLTQETFMRAYASMNTLRGESKLSTWLCGIAKNVALNTLRGRNREFPTIEINDQFNYLRKLGMVVLMNTEGAPFYDAFSALRKLTPVVVKSVERSQANALKEVLPSWRNILGDTFSPTLRPSAL